MAKEWDDDDAYDMIEAREEYENMITAKLVEKRGVVSGNATGFGDVEVKENNEH